MTGSSKDTFTIRWVNLSAGLRQINHKRIYVSVFFFFWEGPGGAMSDLDLRMIMKN
jgi:hypothetical protein